MGNDDLGGTLTVPYYSYECLELKDQRSQLLTDQEPFYRTRSAIVLGDLQRGARIDQWDYQSFAIDNTMWSLLNSCWDREPKRRPTIEKVVQTMESLFDDTESFMSCGEDN